jgi:hypothetical protein
MISCDLLFVFSKKKKKNPSQEMVLYQIKKCLSCFFLKKKMSKLQQILYFHAQRSSQKGDDCFPFPCKTFAKEREGSHDKKALQSSR